MANGRALQNVLADRGRPAAAGTVRRALTQDPLRNDVEQKRHLEVGWLTVVRIRHVGQSLRTGIGAEITGPKAADAPGPAQALGDRDNLVNNPAGSLDLYLQSGSTRHRRDVDWFRVPRAGRMLDVSCVR